jgi:phosphoribosylformimino-5-aminoimidazole carboxamide ribotide isomerase
MQVLPVLDLLDGHVVRGVAGRRQEYRPVQSCLTTSSLPLNVAQAVRQHFDLADLYVADLDAILHGRPQIAIYRNLADAGFRTLTDAGIRRCGDAAPIFNAGAQRVVAGLETLAGPAELAALVSRWSADRIVFSVDLRAGEPLGDPTEWSMEPLAIVHMAVSAGCTQLIVLDIAHVGTSGGVPTLSLCKEIGQQFPNTAIITGGGVRDIADLRRLAELPVDGVLIASALHNGNISRSDLDSLIQGPNNARQLPR